MLSVIIKKRCSCGSLGTSEVEIDDIEKVTDKLMSHKPCKKCNNFYFIVLSSLEDIVICRGSVCKDTLYARAGFIKKECSYCGLELV